MIYLLNISSLFLQKEEIDKIVKNQDNIIRFNNDDIEIEDIILECSYSSFIDTHKYIIVNNFKLTEENKNILKYIESPNSDVTLILNPKAIDKRSKLFKDIKDKVNYIEIKDLKNDEIVFKINEYCKINKIKIDRNSINYLLENNLNEIDLVINEINKLTMINNQISMELINEYSSLIIPDETFALCDAIVEKQSKHIKKLLEDFINTKKEVIPFISLLAMQYRYIYSVKVTNKTADYLSKLYKSRSDYPFKKAIFRQKNYTICELENILVSIANLDIELKTGNKDEYSLLKNFITNIL